MSAANRRDRRRRRPPLPRTASRTRRLSATAKRDGGARDSTGAATCSTRSSSRRFGRASSRSSFSGSFWALLGICWLIGTCGLLFAGDAVEFGAVGGAFFTLFYSVLAFAVLLLVPYGAYRSVLNERVGEHLGSR